MAMNDTNGSLNDELLLIERKGHLNGALSLFSVRTRNMFYYINHTIMNTDFKVAEVELCYKNTVPYREREQIIGSDSAYNILRRFYSDSTIGYRESFKVLYLNNSNQVLACSTISEGGTTCTSVDIRMIMQGALLTNATSIILSHNHPSGNTTPSKQDKDLTERVKSASKILEIRVLDHIILTDCTYYSFAEQEIL